MFALPQYWWILALALAPQLAFLALLPRYRRRGERIVDTEMPRWAVLMLCAGALAGVGYALAQSDWVFLLGQSCVLLVGFANLRHGGPEDS